MSIIYDRHLTPAIEVSDTHLHYPRESSPGWSLDASHCHFRRTPNMGLCVKCAPSSPLFLCSVITVWIHGQPFSAVRKGFILRFVYFGRSRLPKLRQLSVVVFRQFHKKYVKNIKYNIITKANKLLRGQQLVLSFLLIEQFFIPEIYVFVNPPFNLL